jgi:hypothetical protein
VLGPEPQAAGLVGVLSQETMDRSKIVNGTVHGVFIRLKPLDEDASHRQAELGALFPVAADFPIEALEVDPLARFHNGTIQQSRQFFVSHPNLRHGYPLD